MSIILATESEKHLALEWLRSVALSSNEGARSAAIMMDEIAALRALPAGEGVVGREVCPNCYRFKARNADDCAGGDCSKWYAIRDAEAKADCEHFRLKTGYWDRTKASPAPVDAEPVAWRYRFSGLERWHYVERESDCNPHDDYEKQPLYTRPAPANESPVDKQTTEE